MLSIVEPCPLPPAVLPSLGETQGLGWLCTVGRCQEVAGFEEEASGPPQGLFFSRVIFCLLRKHQLWVVLSWEARCSLPKQQPDFWSLFPLTLLVLFSSAEYSCRACPETGARPLNHLLQSQQGIFENRQERQKDSLSLWGPNGEALRQTVFSQNSQQCISQKSVSVENLKSG